MDWLPWLNTISVLLVPLIAVWLAVRLSRSDKDAAAASRRVEEMFTSYIAFTTRSEERDKGVDQRMSDFIARLGSHEETCTRRWGELQREHGEILTTMRRLERLEERRIQTLEENAARKITRRT